MTFADIALGYGAANVLGRLRCVTAQLQLQFVASPQIGDFITCRPEVVRHHASDLHARPHRCRRQDHRECRRNLEGAGTKTALMRRPTRTCGPHPSAAAKRHPIWPACRRCGARSAPRPPH
ncbi:MAG: hotdog domain-containing protein [Rhizomicrobium sp.]